MNTPTPELKPCPFCGTPDPEYDNSDRGTGQWYSCNGCPVRVKVSYDQDLNAVWNTRAAVAQPMQADLLQEIAHLKEVCKQHALEKVEMGRRITELEQPASQAEYGIKEGESIDQAAEGWAQWCEVRGNQMLANFLRANISQHGGNHERPSN